MNTEKNSLYQSSERNCDSQIAIKTRTALQGKNRSQLLESRSTTNFPKAKIIASFRVFIKQGGFEFGAILNLKHRCDAFANPWRDK